MAILAVWAAQATGQAFTVYPDGCRDLIWTQVPGQAPVWRMTDLDLCARQGRSPPGTRLAGFRLAPGAVVAPDLWRALRADQGADAAAVAALTHVPSALAEIMAAAAEPGTVAGLARGLGVGPRRLHRHVVAATGQPPVFWLRLARVRRAMALATGGLVEAALTAGYADQAHFSRDCRAFYGQSPGQLVADRAAMALILAPGFADQPTLVHSSISVPSGART